MEECTITAWWPWENFLSFWSDGWKWRTI